MYHRFKWTEAGNAIPEGHEIDHLCKNRACCNVEHLRCITREQHLKETNEQRWAERKKLAEEYWRLNKTKGVELAALFNVSFGSACRWIREWREVN